MRLALPACALAVVVFVGLGGRAEARLSPRVTPDISVSPTSTSTSTSIPPPLVGGSAPSPGVPVTVAPLPGSRSAPPSSLVPSEPPTTATPAPRSSAEGAPGISWLVWAVGVVVAGLAVAGVVGAREVWRSLRSGKPDARSDETEKAEAADADAGAERLGVWFALAIAAIAGVTALAGWRAEVAGSRGSDADRRGMVAVTELAAARDEAEAQARAEEQTLRRYNAAVEAGRVDSAALQTAGPTMDSLLTIRAAGDLRLARRLHAQFPAEYATTPTAGDDPLVFDVQARINELVAERRVDAEPARWFAIANRAQQHRLWLLGVAVGLVVAMSLVAVGQYRLPNRRRALTMALPGVAVFVAGTCFLLAGVP